MRTAIAQALLVGVAALALAEPANAQELKGVSGSAGSLDEAREDIIVTIEGESMVSPLQDYLIGKLGLQSGAASGKLVVQPMHGFGDQWGEGAQLLWTPPMKLGIPPLDTANAKLPWDFQIPAEHVYRITLAHTVAPDYGQFRVRLDDVTLGEVDGFAPHVSRRQRVLGQMTLTAGEHRLTLEAVGRHPASSGYLVGIDRLELKSLPAQKRPTLKDATQHRRDRLAQPPARRAKLTMPSGSAAAASGGGIGLGTTGVVKSCRTSLSARVEVDTHQLVAPQFGPATTGETKVTLYLRESQAAGNHLNCFYASSSNDIPDLVVTVECTNAAPYGRHQDSYACGH